MLWDRVKLDPWRRLCTVITGLPDDQAQQVAQLLLERATAGQLSDKLTQLKDELKQAIKNAQANALNVFVIELIMSSGAEVRKSNMQQRVHACCGLRPCRLAGLGWSPRSVGSSMSPFSMTAA